MSDNLLNLTINKIEEFLFSDHEQRKDQSRDCGEKLFKDFAKKHRDILINCKLSDSTENKFE
jgi:hypothetical protein